MLVLFEVNDPPLFVSAPIHIHVDPAFTDLRVKGTYLFA
jgi:hypothetical protein